MQTKKFITSLLHIEKNQNHRATRCLSSALFILFIFTIYDGIKHIYINRKIFVF